MNFINRITNKWSAILSMLCFAAIVLSSCSSEDELSPGGVDPDKEVPDPAGTITLSMRDTNNGSTRLDYIEIQHENFTGWLTQFVSVGAVKGLGNVANIPTAGWADEVAVIPGTGYVAYSSNHNKFYRMYVTDYLVSTTGGVIGAEVKYQKPFNGKDETISLDVQSVTMPAEGGVQTLVFKNQGIIVFDIEAKGFIVEKASTYDYPFLANAIAIRSEPNFGTTSIEGSITLTTAYGKKTELKVTQAGSEPFVTFGQGNLELTAAQQTKMVEMFGNIDFNNLSASSSATWCKAELVDNTSWMQAQSHKVKFIGDQPVNTTRTSSDVSTSYSLALLLDENPSTQPRNATIIVKSKDGKVSDTLKVVQKAACVSFGQEQIELSAASQTKMISFTSDISQLQLKSSADWCKVDFGTSKNTIQIECDENTSENSRNATITLQSATGASLAELEVVQTGVIFEVENDKVGFDKKANYRTINITTTGSKWEAESSEEWCTFSKNGNQLTVRVTASTEDRTAVVSFKGFNAKITIHQSKYAVGDTYEEEGIESAVVRYIGDEVRYIYKNLGKAAWSTEYVLTGANDMDNGEYNMDVIKKIPNWEVCYPAFALCEALNTNNISGWYLPAMNELGKIVLAGWSSTEASSDRAYYDYYKSADKKGTIAVYAVRKF